MGIFDIRTVKHSTLYGADTHWANQWRVSAPFDVTNPVIHDLAVYIVELERQLHCDHVIYDYVSIEDGSDPGDAGEHKGLITVTHGSAVAGFQGTPANPSTAREALYIQKYPTAGRLGRWMFFGCLDRDQYRPYKYGHQRLVTHAPYQSVIDTWLDGLATNFGASLTVPQGIFRFGTPYAEPAAIRLEVGSMTQLNATARKQAKSTPKGASIWQGLIEHGRDFALWSDQLNEWSAFNHDFVPQDARDNTVTILGDVKALANSIKNYCSGPDNGDGTNGAAPLFRWQPMADQLLDIASNIIESVPRDLDVINQLETYRFVDGFDYLTHEELDTIISKLPKYSSWLAHFTPADWRNPANVATE